MKIVKDQTTISATDLSNHIACSHATHLERQYATSAIDKPIRKNQFLDRIIEYGNDHEAAYPSPLRENGSLCITELSWNDAQAESKTLIAMQDRSDIIF